MAVEWNPLQGSPGIGLGGSGSASTKRRKGDNREPARTEGGYLIGDRTAGARSNTGMWRQSPRGVAPITKRELNNPGASQFTYQGFNVPMYDDSELVGLPAGASAVIDGKAQGIWGLRNTVSDLQKLINTKNSNRVRELQAKMYRYGWIGKQSITGKASTESFQSTIAYLMYQGNMIGENWEAVLELGPKGVAQAGGRSTGGGGGGGGGGSMLGVPVTTTTSAVDHLTKGNARNYLRDALANVLGRGPQPGEFNEFLDMLREKEQENPVISTTTTVVNSKTDRDTTSERSGGMDQADYQQVAERFANRADPAQADRYKRAGYEQMLNQLIEGGV